MFGGAWSLRETTYVLCNVLELSHNGCLDQHLASNTENNKRNYSYKFFVRVIVYFTDVF